MDHTFPCKPVGDLEEQDIFYVVEGQARGAGALKLEIKGEKSVIGSHDGMKFLIPRDTYVCPIFL